jgi:hypothetical protein
MKNQISPQQQKNQEYITMNIQLAEGKRKTLQINSNSNPEQVAYEFCLKNNLDFDSLQQLTLQIKQAINPSEEFTLMQNNFEKENQNLNAQYEDKPNEKTISINNNNYLDLSDLPESKEERKNNFNSIPYNAKMTSNQPNNMPNIDNNTLSHNSKISQKQKRKVTSYLSPTVSFQSKSKPIVIPSSTDYNDNYNYQSKHNIDEFDTRNINNHQISKSEVSSNINFNRPQSSNMSNLNYGERLYHKGLKLQEKTNEKINMLKSKIEKENNRNNTFHPKINKISYDAISKRLVNKNSYNNEDNIMNYKEYKEQKMNGLKQKYNKDEEFSFTPSINKRSLTMDKQRQKPKTPRYEQLYNFYKKQEANIAEKANYIYNKNTMFKPKVNNYQCPYTNISFDERQKYYLSKSQEKQKILSEQLQNPSDSITGQRFFHPEINTNYERPNTENYDVFENLYKEWDRKQAKQEKTKRENFNKEYLKRIQGHVNEASIELVEIKKEKAFKKIFHTLDKDKDGLLNKLNIEIKALPSNIQKVLEPIFIEIQRDNLTLNEEDFTKACLKLYDNLEFIDRRKILDYARNDNIKNKKYDNLNNFTFKPKINKFYYTNLMKHSPEKGKENRMKNNYFQGSFSHQQQDEKYIQRGDKVKYCSNLTENYYNNMNQQGIENEERLSPVEIGVEQEINNEINEEK